MTISEELNKIAVEHGGTASSDGTIAGAIDALNDALAGSDEPKAESIEGAIKLLGEHIGGGGAVYGYYVNIDCRVITPAKDVYVDIYENEDADNPLFSMSGNIFNTRGLLYCNISCPGDCKDNALWLVHAGGVSERFTDYTMEYSEVDDYTYFMFYVPNIEDVDTIAMT